MRFSSLTPRLAPTAPARPETPTIEPDTNPTTVPEPPTRRGPETPDRGNPDVDPAVKPVEPLRCTNKGGY